MYSPVYMQERENLADIFERQCAHPRPFPRPTARGSRASSRTNERIRAPPPPPPAASHPAPPPQFSMQFNTKKRCRVPNLLFCPRRTRASRARSAAPLWASTHRCAPAGPSPWPRALRRGPRGRRVVFAVRVFVISSTCAFFGLIKGRKKSPRPLYQDLTHSSCRRDGRGFNPRDSSFFFLSFFFSFSHGRPLVGPRPRAQSLARGRARQPTGALVSPRPGARRVIPPAEKTRSFLSAPPFIARCHRGCGACLSARLYMRPPRRRASACAAA